MEGFTSSIGLHNLTEWQIPEYVPPPGIAVQLRGPGRGGPNPPPTVVTGGDGPPDPRTGEPPEGGIGPTDDAGVPVSAGIDGEGGIIIGE